MLQHRPARHAVTRPRYRTAVLLARLALAGAALSALFYVGNLYYTH